MSKKMYKRAEGPLYWKIPDSFLGRIFLKIAKRLSMASHVEVASKKQVKRRREEIVDKFELLADTLKKGGIYFYGDWMDIDQNPNIFDAVREAEKTADKALELLEPWIDY